MNSKFKKNWFKIYFGKHPYLFTFLLGWPILYIIGATIDEFIVNFSGYFLRLFVIFFFLFPPMIFFLWLQKNRTKISQTLFYTIVGLISFVFISLIIVVVNLGGFSNFSERVKFEYLAWQLNNRDLCSSLGLAGGFGQYDQFFWEEEYQFLDYFQDETDPVLKKVTNLKNDYLYKFNHCKATRYLLRAAHKDHEVAKDILSVFHLSAFAYMYGTNRSLFSKYTNSLDENNLYNAPLINAFAFKPNENGDDLLFSLEKRRKMHKEASEKEYLRGMYHYLETFEEEEDFDKSECPFILKYSNHLYEKNSLLGIVEVSWALIGKTSGVWTQAIYKCSNKKTDFAKAISIWKDLVSNLQNQSNSNSFISVYPAMIYFNGWGNVEKDKELAIELFKRNKDHDIAFAYLLLVKLNQQKDTNNKEIEKLLEELVTEKIDGSSVVPPSKLYISCQNTKYDFIIPNTEDSYGDAKNEYLKPLVLCLKESSNKERIESVKSYIKSWTENWFKNPELIATLNFFG